VKHYITYNMYKRAGSFFL